ncbi:MAG: carbohydrate-binding domain-containing protein [Candidatus Ornithospirochaeta sp.]|nr:carbohydrate-binding domain-containing protein [Sphaerochaetaceae bacterium]MDY5523268.1 carbohydrate-binding domain-containing protein [Candidatus Ornithospirochaeta sp.]
MKIKAAFCILSALLILVVGCATKSEENFTENNGEVVPEPYPPFPMEGYGREAMGKVFPEGGMAFGGRMDEAIGTLREDVEFSSNLDYETAGTSLPFSFPEEEYQNYPILLSPNGLVGTTRMFTYLTVEERDGMIYITNTSSEKYNVILSGEWNGGITIESEEADIMVTLASSTITASTTPALVLKGGNTTYLKLEGSSLLSDTIDNGKKGALTSDGNIVIFGEGEVEIRGDKKHGLKVDGTVEIDGGDITINISEMAEGNGISADDAFLMNGGKLVINALGSVYGEESKGIKVNGIEGDDPKGWIEINGGVILIESVGKGITAGFDVDEDSETERVDDDPTPNLTINGGWIRIHTTGEPYEVSEDESLSPEGIEAKNELRINGGIIEISATDDAINAGSLIAINGGYVFALSRGDDGADSNGIFTVSGGTSIFVGAGGIGLGIDSDADRNFTYEGGKVIAIGGGNNAPEKALSFSFDVSSSSFALLDEKGKVVVALSLPLQSENRNVMVLSDSLETGKTYSVLSDVEVEGDENFNGLFTGNVTINGGNTVYSALTQAGASGNHYSMGGREEFPGAMDMRNKGEFPPSVRGEFPPVGN